jgi:hypothetical protein
LTKIVFFQVLAMAGKVGFSSSCVWVSHLIVFRFETRPVVWACLNL